MPARPPGAGPVPPGMSPPCWWATGARSVPGGGPLVTVPPPLRACGWAPCVRAHVCVSPRFLPPPPMPAPGPVARPESSPPPPPPSPPWTVYRNIEKKKNKLCRWPAASQKHLMSRSAQAALRGCVNLEEFPAWEMLAAGVSLPKHPSAAPLRTAVPGAARVRGGVVLPCFDPGPSVEAGGSGGALRMVPGRGVPWKPAASQAAPGSKHTAPGAGGGAQRLHPAPRRRPGPALSPACPLTAAQRRGLLRNKQRQQQKTKEKWW